MFIRQIINNNVVLVRNTGGKELIVVAKGIGYHGRTGAAVDLKRYPDHRLFVPDDAEHARIRQIYTPSAVSISVIRLIVPGSIPQQRSISPMAASQSRTVCRDAVFGSMI